MHELSIAMSLVELASEKAESLGDVRVEALHLRIGYLAGVVREALEFSFELAAGGSRVEGARLVVERVPVAVYCSPCAAEREPPDPLALLCPVCGRPTPSILRGNELELRALEVSSR
jgi:hydrogenase nickel incorporation protein HypA/HybF